MVIWCCAVRCAQVRSLRASTRRRGRLTAAAAAVVAAAVLVGGGVVAGQVTADPKPAVVAGARTGTATQGPVTATIGLTPATGWVRLAAMVRGVPAGERCRLVVVARDGRREVAGGWVVAGGGAVVNGSAAVAMNDVAAVVVENEAGWQYAQVRV